MNNIDDEYISRVLNKKEQLIYNNLLKVLRLKQVDIEPNVLINYIRSHSLTDIYITSEILDRIIQNCLEIQNDTNNNTTTMANIVPNTSIDIPENIPGNIQDNQMNQDNQQKKKEKEASYNLLENKPMNLGENDIKVLESIIKNTKSKVTQRELREELIYIKGISGDNGKFTNTFLLNKRYNNVESIELISGYVLDDIRQSISGDAWSGTGAGNEGFDQGSFNPHNGGMLGQPGQGILFETTTGMGSQGGSIGYVPFIWIDIKEPVTHVYSHYANYSVTESTGNCSDCSGSSSFCAKCGQTGESFVPCSPYGSFFVQLKKHNYASGDTIGNEVLLKNQIYLVDKTGNYIKYFNNLVSLNKLKINIRNVVGTYLWGCDKCGNSYGQDTGRGEKNLLRWEFIFKVRYYINTLQNDFILHSS